MAKPTDIDLIDRLIDCFEDAWSCDDSIRLHQWLLRFDLQSSVDAAAELIRVDIQRRYDAGYDVNLTTYFDQIPFLQSDSQRLHDIAFEDYRSRKKHLLPVDRERWNNIPEISKVTWFKELGLGEVFNTTNRRESHRLKVSGSHLPSNELLVSELQGLGFEIVSRLGDGALSVVYLATQRSLSDRHVVLKIVSNHLNEPEHLARLQHTNIVPIYSFHPLTHGSALCMPYWGSITLEDYLHENPSSVQRSGQSFVSTITLGNRSTIVGDRTLQKSVLGLDDGRNAAPSPLPTPLENLVPLDHNRLTLWLFLKIADALSHAHARGVLHGDLKPANVLIRNDGEPALLDFNLSQRLGDSTIEVTGGTLPYMPPEILLAMMGQAQLPKTESDIYSFGILMFQFTSGRLPFDPPRSSAAVDLQVALAQRKSKLELRSISIASPGLTAIISKCIAYEASDRYQNADQLRRDIQCEIDSLPLVYAQESWATRLKKFARRHPVLSSNVTLAAVACILIATVGLSMVRYRNHYKRLESQQIFERFIGRSNDALAAMLAIDESEWRLACDEADRCMEIYGVGTRSDWQSTEPWQSLGSHNRQAALNRLTDLLYRSTFRMVEDWKEDHQNTDAELPVALWTRLSILRSEPFRLAAPASITKLKPESIGRIVRDASLIDQNADQISNKPLSLLPPLSQRPVDAFAEAMRRFYNAEYSGAMELLTPELLGQVDPFSFWILLGRSQLELGQLDAAELSFSMAIEQGQLRPLGLFYRGVCRMREREPGAIESAIADLDIVIREKPQWADARINRALARESLGDFQAAIDDLSIAEGMNHNKHLLFLIRSRVHRKMNLPDLAKRDLEFSLRESPKTVQGWISRALARLPIDPSGAMTDLQQARQIAPDSLDILQNQAHVYSEHLDEPLKAIECLTDALQLSPTYEKALLGRAVIFGRLGNVQAAMADLHAAESRLTQLTPASHYQAACALSLVFGHLSDDDPRKTRSLKDGLSMLGRALQRGYGSDLLESDPDLNAFRLHTDFEIITRFLQLGGKP